MAESAIKPLTEFKDFKRIVPLVVERLAEWLRSSPLSEQWHIRRMTSSLQLLERDIVIGKHLFVDSWPSFTCVFLLRDYDDETDELEALCRNVEEEKIRTMTLAFELLESVGKRHHRLITLPDFLHDFVRYDKDKYELLTEMVSNNHWRTEPLLCEVSLPGHLTCRRLSEDCLEIIMGNWIYSTPKSTTPWLKEVLHLSGPNLGIFCKDELIGHVLKGRQATLGLLYVNPDYRGQKIGRYLVQEYVKQELEDKEYVLSETDFPHTKEFFDHLGFSVISRTAYFCLKRKSS